MRRYFQGYTKEHWLMSSVLVSGIFVILSSAVYIFVGITRASAWCTAILTLLFGWYILKKVPEWITTPAESVTQNDSPTKFFYRVCGGILILDGVILWLLFHARTDENLQTPWANTPIILFILFWIASGLLVFATARAKKSFFLALLVVAHFCIMYGAGIITFKHGFGYDPLIHQAAEKYIVQHGQIKPLQPFYIGEYAPVAVLHLTTRMPIIGINRLLIPVLAGIIFPLDLMVVFSRGASSKNPLFFTLIFLCVTLYEFTFTVPYNLTVWYVLLFFMLLPMAEKNRSWLRVLFVLGIAAAITHPLLGVPLLLASIVAFIPLSRRASVIAAGEIALVIPLMFGVYRFTKGETPFETLAFWEHAKEALYLFRFPYHIPASSWISYVVYHVWYLLPFAVVIAGVFVIARKKDVSPLLRRMTAIFNAGVLGGLFLFVTTMRVPGVAEYEQNEFALRLRYVLPLLFLPIIFYALPSFFESILARKRIMLVIAPTVAILITISFYTSYPPLPSVDPYSGWNAGRGDAIAVHRILEHAGGAPYSVLSDQLLAGVALRELGFERMRTEEDESSFYPYPLGPRVLLYPYAERVLYENVFKEDIEELKNITNGRVYLAIHDFWYRKNDIMAEAKSAGAETLPGESGVHIFWFK